MEPISNMMYTKLEDGDVVVFIRHYYKSAYAGRLSYNSTEDTIVSRTPVRNPIPMWDGKPFVGYEKEFAGRLSYKEFCEEVNKDSIWVFHNFTKCSNRMFEEVSRVCK